MKRYSRGYRETAQNRESMRYLRGELAKCHKSEWVKAHCIMQAIAILAPSHSGPSGVIVQPRTCSYCKFYGHSRNHCARYKQDEDARNAALLEHERRFLRSMGARDIP